MEYGIRIIKIGTNLPKSDLRNTVQITDSGQQYLVDRKGIILLLGGTDGSNGNVFINGGPITSLASIGYNPGINISLEDWINSVFYDSQLPIAGLTGGGTFEFTADSTSLKQLSWTATRQSATQSLVSIIVNGIAQLFVPPAAGGTVIGALNVTINNNVTSSFTSTVTTLDGKVAVATTVFNFRHKFYRGFVSVSNPTDANLIAAGGIFATNYNASGVFTAPLSESYVAFAFPLSFGNLPTIKINGLAVEYILTQRAFINPLGYSEIYNIFVSPFSTNSGLDYEVL